MLTLHPDIVGDICKYLSIKDCFSLKECNSVLCEAVYTPVIATVIFHEPRIYLKLHASYGNARMIKIGEGITADDEDALRDIEMLCVENYRRTELLDLIPRLTKLREIYVKDVVILPCYVNDMRLLMDRRAFVSTMCVNMNMYNIIDIVRLGITVDTLELMGTGMRHYDAESLNTKVIECERERARSGFRANKIVYLWEKHASDDMPAITQCARTLAASLGIGLSSVSIEYCVCNNDCSECESIRASRNADWRQRDMWQMMHENYAIDRFYSRVFNTSVKRKHIHAAHAARNVK